MTDNLTALRLELSEHGYPPVPVTSPDAVGVASPGKAPMMKDWQNVCRGADAREITSWRFRYADHGNTGILCGNVVAVDIDVLDAELVAKLEVHVKTRLGETPLRRVGLWQKCVLVFRTDAPFHKMATALFSYRGKPARVEILAEGEQFVAFGEHPSGKAYTWDGDTPRQMALSDLPTVTAGLCGAFLEECEIIMIGQDAVHAGTRGQARPQAARGGADRIPGGWCGKAGVRPPRELVIDALQHIPNTDLDRDTWIALGFSLYAALGPDGGDVWEEWSAQYAGNVPANNQHAWASFANIRYSDHRKLFSWAEMRGWKGWPAEDREGRKPDAPPDLAPAGAVSPDLGIWDAGEDDYVIPPREWLLGTAFCRTFVSTLIADGAVGKTTVRIVQHLALASGRPITGEHVFVRCRTLLLCFEDDRNELRRRVYAAMRHHGIAPSDIRGWMFLGAIRQVGMKLALLDNYGNAIRGPLEQVLADEIRGKGIDLVTLDPFVKTHALEENSNPHMDFVTGMLAEMASMLNIATDLTHHTSKGPADAGNADRGRGASSAKNAGRLVKTLAGMTIEEAQAFDVADLDRRSLVRMDNGKVNLAPPASEAQWLRLVSVNLGNKTDTYPHGDEVQAVEIWDPPGKTAGLSHFILNQILDRIDGGMENGERYSAASAADVRAVWPVFAELAPTCSDRQGRRIVKDWLDSGTLYYRLYKSPRFRKERQGLYVHSGKRPS